VCAHYRIAQGLKEFLALFAIEPEDVPPPPPGAEEGLPSKPVAAIVHDPSTGKLKLAYPRWGLVPGWMNEESGTKLLHARAETIAEKPSYREAFRKRRCILPISSFFEFDKTSRYLVSMEDHAFMGVAGIWERKDHAVESPLVTCAMVTTASNELVGQYLDRMPAILKPEHYHPWLNPSTVERELHEMLQTFPPEHMRSEFDGLKAAYARAAESKQPELFE